MSAPSDAELQELAASIARYLAADDRTGELPELQRQLKHAAASDGELTESGDSGSAAEQQLSWPWVSPAWDSKWVTATAPLYSTAMGCENMGPLLYSIVRFHKPKKILEVGAGYTSIWLLQAVHENVQELEANQRLNTAGHEWPKLNWCVDGYLGQYHHGLVYCIDNLQHTATTAQRVIDTAAQLGLSDYLEMRDADAYEYANELADEEEEGALGLLWVDFGDGDKLDDFFQLYWDYVDPNGGLVLVHSTLTNEMSRDWLKKMTELSKRRREDVPDDDRFGLFEILSVMEPHKMCQNSCTMIRRQGFPNDPYSEPVYTRFA